MPNRAKTILLVEDNPDDQELTLRSLQDSRVANNVVIVRDGAEAIDYLFARGQYASRDPNDRPTVVLLDLKLPKVSGLDVLRTLRADGRFTTLPVVILTSSKEEQDVVAGYALGANSYVRKPVAFDEFAAAVRELGLYWLVLNESAPVPAPAHT